MMNGTGGRIQYAPAPSPALTCGDVVERIQRRFGSQRYLVV